MRNMRSAQDRSDTEISKTIKAVRNNGSAEDQSMRGLVIFGANIRKNLA